MPIPLPSLAEQKRIVAKINKLKPMVDDLGRLIAEREAFRQAAPQHFRASLLQEAMCGKLVPQLDSEPAVEQIGPAPAADEVPFEIPEKWKWVRLQELGKLATGKTPSTSHPEYFSKDIPFITPGDIDERSRIVYTNRALSEEARKVVKTFPANTTLMVCIGGTIGKCGVADREITFNQQINAIVPETKAVSAPYLLHVLQSPYFRQQLKAQAKGTATPIINKKEWGSLFVPLPPLEEQKRIVAKLNSLLPQVDALAKAITAS